MSKRHRFGRTFLDMCMIHMASKDSTNYVKPILTLGPQCKPSLSLSAQCYGRPKCVQCMSHYINRLYDERNLHSCPCALPHPLSSFLFFLFFCFFLLYFLFLKNNQLDIFHPLSCGHKSQSQLTYCRKIQSRAGCGQLSWDIIHLSCEYYKVQESSNCISYPMACLLFINIQYVQAHLCGISILSQLMDTIPHRIINIHHFIHNLMSKVSSDCGIVNQV